MDLGLRGLRTLVTGSTAGIGLGIAKRLAAEGAHVAVSGRTAARVDAAIAEVKRSAQHGAQVTGVVADLGTAAGVAKAIEQVPELDVLVNNVGAFAAIPFEQITAEQWKEIFDVNVLSGVLLSRHHFPKMLKRNAGRIIFISSESAVQIPAEMIHYGVTKTAQAALARGLAELTKGTAVTVNSVLVGPTKSEGVGQFVEGLAAQQKTTAAEVEKDFFKNARPSSLLQRFLDVDEIGNVVAFIASPLASSVNGAAVRADGGVTRAVF